MSRRRLLPEAGEQRRFQEPLRVSRHENPTNQTHWQRDLWVSHYRVADLLEELGDVQAKTHWQKAHDILAGMVQAGLHVSAQDLSFLQHLRTKIGG